MACVAATENCLVDDDLNIEELSNIDSSLLMSLLEDSQAEDGEDEVLRAVIQSLEPVILNQDSCSETDNSEGPYRFSSECCSTSPDHHPAEFEWLGMEMEMEMEMEIAYSCPGYGMNGYFAGRFTGNMTEVGEFEEDNSQACYGMPMEEDDYIGLWQYS